MAKPQPRPGAGNSAGMTRIGAVPPGGPLWGQPGCLYSLIASMALTGSATRNGHAEEKATPRGQQYRGQSLMR
jgi:hypothetical protein